MTPIKAEMLQLSTRISLSLLLLASSRGSTRVVGVSVVKISEEEEEQEDIFSLCCTVLDDYVIEPSILSQDFSRRFHHIEHLPHHLGVAQKQHNSTMIATPTSQSELHLLCVSAIVRDLIAQHSDSSSSTSAQEPPNLSAIRLKYSKKYNLSVVPRLTDVLAAVPEEWKDRLRGWLRAKPVRTASGVAVVAVMCKPHRCPHVAMTGNICV